MVPQPNAARRLIRWLFGTGGQQPLPPIADWLRWSPGRRFKHPHPSGYCRCSGCCFEEVNHGLCEKHAEDKRRWNPNAS